MIPLLRAAALATVLGCGASPSPQPPAAPEATSPQEGPVVEYWPDGQIKAEGTTVDGKRDGTWTTRHPDGWTLRVEQWRNGVRHGPYQIWWNADVLKFEGVSWEGDNHGPYRHWYETGQIRREGTFERGEPVGEWKTWHPNGQLASQGEYRDGERVGSWSYWDEAGRPEQVD